MISVSVADIQKNTTLLTKITEPLEVIDKRKKKKVATIYPNVKHNITEKLAGKYKDFAKDKSFHKVKQEALMQAFGEKYDKLN